MNNCKIKKDCFAYEQDKNTCWCLNKLYCEKEECNFYKSNKQVKRSDLEKQLKQ